MVGKEQDNRDSGRDISSNSQRAALLLTRRQGLDCLQNLKILSMPSNRLTHISGLEKLVNLEELHISHNALSSLAGLEANTNIRVLDITANPIDALAGLATLTVLEELWASYCRFSDFAEVERELADKKELNTVYFEGTPLQLRQPVLYRNKVRLALPQIKQIDASKLHFLVSLIRRSSGTVIIIALEDTPALLLFNNSCAQNCVTGFWLQTLE